MLFQLILIPPKVPIVFNRVPLEPVASKVSISHKSWRKELVLDQNFF